MSISLFFNNKISNDNITESYSIYLSAILLHLGHTVNLIYSLLYREYKQSIPV